MAADKKRSFGGLTASEKLVIEAYTANGFDSSKVAEVTGMGLSQVSEILARPVVTDKIECGMRQLVGAAGVTQDRVARRFAQMAFANIFDIVDADGDLKPLDDIPEESRTLIKSIRKTTGKYGTNVSVELHDSFKALERIAKWLDMDMKEDAPVEVNVGVGVQGAETVDIDMRLEALARGGREYVMGVHEEPEGEEDDLFS